MPGTGSVPESCACTLGGATFKLRRRVVIPGEGEARGAGKKERKEKQFVR